MEETVPTIHTRMVRRNILCVKKRQAAVLSRPQRSKTALGPARQGGRSGAIGVRPLYRHGLRRSAPESQRKIQGAAPGDAA